MLFMLHPVSRAKRGGKRRSKRLSRIHMATNLIPPAPRQRKPDWIRVKAPIGAAFDQTRSLMRRLKLATVSEEAACPNIGECWPKKHATVMILGDVCPRACAFCNVKPGMPRAVDSPEPQPVADAAAELGLAGTVITSVDSTHLPAGRPKQVMKVKKRR